MFRKIPTRCFILFAIIFTFACNTNSYKSSIPSAPINIRLYLPNYIRLSAPNENMYFTERNEVNGVFAIGYGGVLIHTYVDTRNGNTLYSAFDMACPYEINRNTRVYPDNTGMYAVCEECDSKFDLSTGLGQVAQEPAKENLKRFNAFIDGAYLRVIPRHE